MKPSLCFFRSHTHFSHIPSPSLTSGNHSPVPHLYNLLISGMLHAWNHKARSPFCLVGFLERAHVCVSAAGERSGGKRGNPEQASCPERSGTWGLKLTTPKSWPGPNQELDAQPTDPRKGAKQVTLLIGFFPPTWCNSLKIHPGYCMYQYFLSF